MFESSTDTAKEPGIDALTESDRYEILRTARRRHVVDVLAGRSIPIDLQGLAAAVAAREPDTDVGDGETLTHVATSLHHVHIPKLASYDLLEYDRAGLQIVQSQVPAKLAPDEDI